MKYFRFFLSVQILLVIIFIPLSVEAKQVQKVIPAQRNQIAAESKFNQAYVSIMKRHYWSGIELADQSLDLNPYYVDGYLLKSLALYRMGHLERAIQNLDYYLEVRPRDYIAHKIYQGIKKIPQNTLASLPVIYGGNVQQLTDYLQLYPGTYSGTTGIGNATCVGDRICIPDMLGDRVFILSRQRVRSINVKKPVSITPVDDFTFVVTTGNGLLEEYHIDVSGILKKTRESRIDEAIGHMAFITADKCVFSHPISGTITVRTYPELKVIEKWMPHEDKFKEIRNLSVMGNMIAIASRNNDEVLVTDIEFKKKPKSIKIDSPRSVLLESRKDLLVLSDTGTLTLLRLEEGNWIEKETMKTPEGFSLFSSQNKIFVITADGRKIYTFTGIPADKETIMTGMALFNPEIKKTEQGKILSLHANVSTSFADYISMQRPVFSSVWQSTMRPGQIKLTSRETGYTYVIASKKNRYSVSGNSSVVILDKDKSLEEVIKKIWEEKSDISSIILDSSIKVGKNGIVWLLRFCKFNGIVLNCWSTQIPSEDLLDATLNSGGKCYFALNLSSENIKKQKTSNLKIEIFYQKTTYSSGYPSKNMLSTIADFGIISYRDWLPVWPDLLKVKQEI